jgi:hypothetical protein
MVGSTLDTWKKKRVGLAVYGVTRPVPCSRIIMDMTTICRVENDLEDRLLLPALVWSSKGRNRKPQFPGSDLNPIFLNTNQKPHLCANIYSASTVQ